MNNFSDIIKIIKKIKKLKTDGEVADLFGIKQQTLASAKRRNSIPFEELASFCKKENFYLDWFLTGEGEMEKGAEPSFNREEFLAREKASEYEVNPSDITDSIRLLIKIFEEGNKEKIQGVISVLKALTQPAMLTYDEAAESSVDSASKKEKK